MIPLWFPSSQPEGRDWLREHGMFSPGCGEEAGGRVNLIALSSPQGCCLLHKVFLTAMVKVVPLSVGLPVGLLPG